MPGETNNPFRQVALLLISLTIITLGIVYNQTISSPSSPKTSIETKGTNFFSLFTKQPSSAQMGATTGQLTAPTPTAGTAPTPGVIVVPGPSPKTTTTPAIPETYQERLGEAMRLLSSLIVPQLTFAQQSLNINIPGIGFSTTPVPDNSLLPEISLPETPSALPAEEEAPTNGGDNTPVKRSAPTLKDITGYRQWEEFKENFRESQQKYAGTGKCMINITGFGCLVTW